VLSMQIVLGPGELEFEAQRSGGAVGQRLVQPASRKAIMNYGCYAGPSWQKALWAVRLSSLDSSSSILSTQMTQMTRGLACLLLC
jgi:hypothetical protein